MKRAHGHLAFALVAAALGVLTAAEALRLQHAQQINTSVAEWSAAPVLEPRTAPASPPPALANTQAAPASPPPAPATSHAVTTPPATSSKWSASTAIDHLSPEARLARAVALSRLDYDAALAAYKVNHPIKPRRPPPYSPLRPRQPQSPSGCPIRTRRRSAVPPPDRTRKTKLPGPVTPRPNRLGRTLQPRARPTPRARRRRRRQRRHQPP